MIGRKTAELAYRQFDLLARYGQVIHAVTTRHGDRLRHPDGLNLSMAATTRPSEVVSARADVCAMLGLQLEDLVVPRQVHGRQVAVVGRTDRGKGSRDRDTAIQDTDGLVTSDAGVGLFVSAADCVPLLFYDPVVGAIGAAHAGWRGTVAGIARVTVETMIREFGCKASDIVAGIGPSIGPCCYTVGDEVARAVADAFGERSGLISVVDGQNRLDLWAANRAGLVRAGLMDSNIETAALCTSCHNDVFFSHRAEHGRAGRFAAIIFLKAEESR